MKEKVAIITKDAILQSKERARIIDAIRNDGSFEVYEISQNQGIIEGTSVAIAFGGDGTMLEAVKLTLSQNIPVLGINLGNLGFLTSCEKDVDTKAVIDAIKARNIESKMTLKTTGEGFLSHALNEVVIRATNYRPVRIELYVDGAFVDCFHADGAIVSTPTGSTAYSLSSGGPILAPDVEAFVINPICAHSLHSRPIVVSANSHVTLKLVGDERAIVCIDGRKAKDLSTGEEIEVCKSQIQAQFITLDKSDFYNKLLHKMNSWGTTAKG